MLLVLLAPPAAGRTGREVLIRIQESVVLKFILTVMGLVRNWCQNCWNYTFVSFEVQLEVVCPFCPALMTSLSALCVTSVCVLLLAKPKLFALFIYNSEAVFAYVSNKALGKLISCCYSNTFQYLFT